MYLLVERCTQSGLASFKLLSNSSQIKMFIRITATVVVLQAAIFLLPQYEAKDNIEPMIVGGENATLGEFPFVVAIYNYYYYKGEKMWCSGILIRPDLVLTHARCMNFAKSTVSVVAGTVTPSLDDRNDQKMLKPLAVVPHPDRDSEFGLMYLDGQFPLSETIKPAKLPTYLGEPKDAKNGILIGWGYLDEDRQIEAKNLQKVELPIVDNFTCSGLYGGRWEIDFDLNLQFCAGEKNKGGCYFYDSGSPLVLSSDVTTIHGLYRMGGPCNGSFAGLGLYTRIGSYLPWLREEMSKGPPTTTTTSTTTTTTTTPPTTEKSGGRRNLEISLILSIFSIALASGI